MTDIVLSIVMLAALALVAGAYALWRRTGDAKNPALMVLLAVIAVIAMFALALVVGIVGGILMLVGSIVTTALGMLLVMPIYVGMLLVIYVVMFGAMYFMWRDVCGDAPAAVAPSDDRIEL